MMTTSGLMWMWIVCTGASRHSFRVLSEPAAVVGSPKKMKRSKLNKRHRQWGQWVHSDDEGAREGAAEVEWKTHVRRRYICTHFSSLFFFFFLFRKEIMMSDIWLSLLLFSRIYFISSFLFVAFLLEYIYDAECCFLFCFLHKFNLLFFHKHVSFFVHG